MKKLVLIILLSALLLSIFGCVASNPASDDTPSQPTESTAPKTDVTDPPQEPTAPTEATVPTDVATSGNMNPGPYGVALSPETLAEAEFAQWRGDDGEYYRYGYVGEDSTVTMPGGGVSITFPEGWVDDLTIVWYQYSEDTSWTADVSSEALLRAWAAYREGVAPEDVDNGMLAGYAGVNYVIRIIGIPNDVTNVAYLPGQYLGKDESYTYIFSIPDMWVNQSEQWHYREDMIEALGEDTYNDLLGDMVITEEMAKEMITITNPIDE